MKRAILLPVLILFAVLGAYYAFTYPLFEGMDEVSHYWHANYVADNHRLPDLNDYGFDALTYERHQMPLYYVLAAAVIAPIDRHDFADYAGFNTNYSPDVLHIHTEDELAWPPQTTILAVRVARLLSVALGLATLVLTYRAIITLGFGAPIALTAVASMALNPKFVHLSSSVSNDMAAASASAAVVLALAGIIAVRRAGGVVSGRRVAVLGMLAGIAFLAKANAIVVILAPVGVTLVWASSAGRRLNVRRLLEWSVLLGFGCVLVSGPYLAYSTLKYGDPLALAQRARILSTYVRSVPLSLADLPAGLSAMLLSYWDMLGNGIATPYQYVGYALGGLTCLGLLLALKRTKFGQPGILPVMLGSLLGANAVLWLFWYYRDIGGAYGRYFGPAFITIHLLIGIAFHALFGERLLMRTRWIWLPAGAAGALLVLPLWVVPASEPVIYMSPARARALPVTGRVTFDNGIQLVSAVPDRLRLDPGQDLDLSVQWRLTGQTPQLSWLVVTLADQNGREISRQAIRPFDGRYDTQRWGEGVLQDRYPIAIPAVARSTLVNVLLGWYEYDAPHRVAGVIPSGSQAAVVATIKVRGARPAETTPSHEAQALFGQAIALEGYDLSDGRLTLYWRSVRPVDHAYSVFVHMHDVSGALVGQTDGPVAYSTQYWDAGEQVIDQRALPRANGPYEIRIGLYDLRTGQRLAAQSDTAPVADDAVTAVGAQAR